MLALGPVVDEIMWQAPELDLFWAGQEPFQSLKITRLFLSYVSFLTAQAQKFIYAIESHEALSSMRELIPQLKVFIAAIDKQREELNNARLVLAQRYALWEYHV